MKRFLLSCLCLVAGAASAAHAAGIELVRNGRAAATIVTTDQPNPVVAYAAQELAYHVERATGAKLSIVPESASSTAAGAQILLGDTRAARAAGIEARTLAPEACAFRTSGDRLIVAGRDDSGDPLERDTSAGTLFGVYELLEREVGVRWLWPGELGTCVPQVKTLTVRLPDDPIAPRFFQRHVRTGLTFKSDHPALGFTPQAAEAYAQEQTIFLRRHRMGRSQKLSYGHAFTDWWEKYGAAHPEWFQLVNGKRGPAKAGARYSMCVSNPELQQQIVANWRARGGATAKGPTYLNAVENDILGLCTCEQCLAADGTAPSDALKFYSPKSKVAGSRFVSDRYAKFWLGVQQLAAKENPHAVVVGYVYFNYFQAPTSGVQLNSNILLGFCPSGGWYPRAEDEHAWFKRQWTGWGDTGARLFSRTNYFLDGYCMPFIFAHQFADDFQNEARHGMVATDFDSLTGQWSTQGPNLYLLMRLHTRPEARTDDLLAEYYAGFGAAAALVKEYFDYWEGYTMGHRAQINATFDQLEASRWRSWAKAAHATFPADCFATGEQLLARAAAAVKGDKESAARVDFLRLGLEHAKLASRVAGLLTLADPQASPQRGAAALAELLRFRRAHERLWLANFNHEAWVESLSWKLSSETKQAPDLYP
jgi:hypothetical protein